MALSAKIAKSIALIQNPSIEMVSKKSISFKLLDSIAVDSASLMPADVAKIILLLNHTEPAVITTAFCFLICISKNRPDLKRHMMAYAFPQAVLKLTSLDNPCIEGALDFLIELLRYNPDVDAITDSLYSNADVRHTFAIILSHQLPLAEKIQALISVTSSPDLESVLKEKSPVELFLQACAMLRAAIDRGPSCPSVIFSFIRIIVEAKNLPVWLDHVSSMTPELIKVFEHQKTNEAINTDLMIHTLWLLCRALKANPSNLQLLITIKSKLESLSTNVAAIDLVKQGAGSLLKAIDRLCGISADSATGASAVARVFSDEGKPKSGGAASSSAAP